MSLSLFRSQDYQFLIYKMAQWVKVLAVQALFGTKRTWSVWCFGNKSREAEAGELLQV